MNESSMIDEDKINEKVQIVSRQTNYTEDEIREKLKAFDYNEINVIKSYFGIKEKKPEPITSVNQEIYKQLRHHLDIKKYRDGLSNNPQL